MLQPVRLRKVPDKCVAMLIRGCSWLTTLQLRNALTACPMSRTHHDLPPVVGTLLLRLMI